MKDDGFAYISDGALVVDVKEETDTKEIPPCMILKSDGASLYNTTDLATMVWRMKDYNPDELIYVVDKRQELYFTQVFRCARKTGIVKWSVTGSVPECAAGRLLSEAETAAVSDCQERQRGFRQA